MSVPLVCPGCRRISERGLELSTLETSDGHLACACGRTYPIVDGVPVVVPQPDEVLLAQALERAALQLDALPPEELPGPDGDPGPRLAEHLSTYLDAHWGDGIDSPIRARLRGRAAVRVEAAIELGCSVGGDLAALALGADFALGIELRLAAAARAKRLLSGEPLTYARRTVGRHYTRTELAPAPTPNAQVVCADALDPPVPPESFDRVVAFGLLDSVADPNQLLSVVDGLCAPGGELLLATPYAWSSDITGDAQRPGGRDPAAWLRTRLTTGDGLRARYLIEDEAELPWELRRDDRVTLRYRCHYLRARRR